MKRVSFLLLLFSILLAAVNFAMADDFYYTGSPSYNPYNGYTVMSLPPPPPMSSVPFYVRDDYDDYLEDYYKCILGYEYKGMTCRYWRNYAEKNGFYQRNPPAQTGRVQNNMQATGQQYNAPAPAAPAPAAPANTQNTNQASGNNVPEPYTPQR